MEREGDVNNYPKSNTRVIPFSYRLTIDRIQLSIRNRYGSYKFTKELFSNLFGKPKVNYPDGKAGKVVNEFHHDGKKIQLVNCNHAEYNFWFSVTINDPDDYIQKLIRDVFYYMFGSELNHMVTIKEIEFAWDIYPDNINYVWIVRNVINNSIYLKHSRAGACGIYKTTFYQGNKGNAHKGSKGSRAYEKSINQEAFFRVELQLNREYVKKMEIIIESLPLTPYMIEFYDFYEFRKGYDGQAHIDLINELFLMNNKRTSIKIKKPSKLSMGRRVFYQACIANSTTEKHRKYFDDVIPVIEQASTFKILKKKFRLSCPLNRFFPVDDVIRFRDPKYHRGSLKVPQWMESVY